MASTVDLPSKSTRRMDADEIRAEAQRFGVAVSGDIEDLRRALKAELERRWSIENREAMEGWNRWIAENGIPLEEYRVW